MNRAAHLAAIRARTPDSIAPDGGMLRFIPVACPCCLRGEEERGGCQHNARRRAYDILTGEATRSVLAGLRSQLSHGAPEPTHSRNDAPHHALSGNSNSNSFVPHNHGV